MIYELMIAAGLFAVIFLTFLVYWSKAHSAIKMITLIGLLALGMLALAFYDEMLGAPLPFKPNGEFYLVHHIVTPDEKIYIWAYFIESKDHRLHVIPYDRETASKLAESERKGENGNPEYMRFEQRSGGGHVLLSRPVEIQGNTQPKGDQGNIDGRHP